MATPFDDQVAELNERIEELKRQAAQAEQDANHHARCRRRLTVREAYLRAAIWLRSVGVELDYWRTGVLGVLPLILAAAVFLIVALVTDRMGWAFIVALPVLLASLAVVFRMLYHGRTDELLEQLATVRVDRQAAQQTTAAARGARTAALGQLHDLLAQRSELIASDKFRREQLLKRDWQRMRSAEWREFLSEALASHGASVDVVRRGTYPEPDMIANFRGRRIAIQARGRDHTINNVTVQQAVESMAHYRCHGCAVITNQRITASARELARHHGCQLVGAHNFASWLRGEWQL